MRRHRLSQYQCNNDFSKNNTHDLRCTNKSNDYGPNPLVVNIEEAALKNNYFRNTLWTGTHLQVTLMCINPGEDIGLEIHPNVDQFIYFVQGQGITMMGDNRCDLNYQKKVCENYAIIIPAGTWHNIVNTGGKPLKLYSIYTPPQHPFGTVHVTKKDDREY